MNTKNKQVGKNNPNLDTMRNWEKDTLVNYIDVVQYDYRKNMYLNEANQEYSKILKIFSERENTPLEIDLNNYMFLEYEISHTEYLLGNFKSAISHSQKSTDYAHKIGDELGYAISYFHTTLMKFFGNTISNDEAFNDFDNSLSKIIELRQQGADLNRCNTWIFNIQNRYIQLLVEMGNDEEAELRFIQCCQSGTFYQDFKSPNPAPLTLETYYSSEARVYFAKGFWKKSLNIYAKFSDIDLSEWGEKDKRILCLPKNEHEAATHYFYIGKNLSKLDLIEYAIEVYHVGLELKPERGNHYFQNKMRNELLHLQQ